MEVIDIVSRIVHVGTAITLVGGMAFTLFVLIPSASRLGKDAHDLLAAEVKGRWKRFVHIGLLLFIVSGFYNYFQAMPLHKGDGPYHGLVGTKMILAFVIFFIASALVGRSAKLQSMRDNKVFWLRIAVLLAAVIVAISGYVKVRGPKSIVKADTVDASAAAPAPAQPEAAVQSEASAQPEDAVQPEAVPAISE